MESSIKLILESSTAKFDVNLNNNQVPFNFNPNDQYDNSTVEFNAQLDKSNLIELKVSQTHNSSTNLKEIIVDDIRFGLVTFLCTTIDNKQETQLNSDGIISIQIETPVWEFWCKKMNSFNYKDYPLGSTS